MEVFVTEDKVFNGLLFQDALMKETFAAYPEVLMVDATYKLNELRMPLYLMIVVDSSGQSEIVGVFITALETEEAISKMVQAFKDQNPAWPSTKVVMSDKDFVERAVSAVSLVFQVSALSPSSMVFSVSAVSLVFSVSAVSAVSGVFPVSAVSLHCVLNVCSVYRH